MALKAKEPMKPEVARERLEVMCARAEHCRAELQQKLYQWRVPSAEAEKILTALAEKRFFDDCRFASVFCRNKMVYSRWGRRKIIFALKAKKIDSAHITRALDEIDQEEYYNIMLGLLRSKASLLKEGNSFEGRTKLFRFGVQRGYEPDLVSKALRSGKVWPEEERVV